MHCLLYWHKLGEAGGGYPGAAHSTFGATQISDTGVKAADNQTRVRSAWTSMLLTVGKPSSIVQATVGSPLVEQLGKAEGVCRAV